MRERASRFGAVRPELARRRVAELAARSRARLAELAGLRRVTECAGSPVLTGIAESARDGRARRGASSRGWVVVRAVGLLALGGELAVGHGVDEHAGVASLAARPVGALDALLGLLGGVGIVGVPTHRRGGCIVVHDYHSFVGIAVRFLVRVFPLLGEKALLLGGRSRGGGLVVIAALGASAGTGAQAFLHLVAQATFLGASGVLAVLLLGGLLLLLGGHCRGGRGGSGSGSGRWCRRWRRRRRRRRGRSGRGISGGDVFRGRASQFYDARFRFVVCGWFAFSVFF